MKLADAAKALEVSRNTVHEIAEKHGLKKFRYTDGKTSPWLLVRAEVEQLRRERLQA
jgi:hypothetical protein